MGDGRAANVAADRLFTGWRGTVLALFCLVMAALCGVQLFANAEQNGVFGVGRASTSGIQMHSLPTGWNLVDQVDHDSGGDRAGIKTGDLVRFDDPLVLSSNPPVGTIAQITLRHSGQASRKLITFSALNSPIDPAVWRLFSFYLGGAVFCWALGVLVLWRGWGDRAALLLAIGLISFPADGTIPWWFLHSPLTPLALGAIMALNLLSVCLFVFPAYLYHTRIAPLGRIWGSVTLGCAIVLTGVYALLNAQRWGMVFLPASLSDAERYVVVAASALVCWWDWRGARDGLGEERNRFRILLLAQSFVLANNLLPVIGAYAPGLWNNAVLAWVIIVLSWVGYPLALAYAVLRHRVIDLGFAFNRTIVYGSVSVLLLVCFGLIEWGIEHWLPEDWVKASVWIDAGAALLVYMAFHRMHGVVETRVEHLFFHKWQSNEAILRRFVASATHFEDERALARSFADELSRFAGDAPVALYRRKERTHDAILERVTGSWETAPRTLPIDDPAFALMRAERRALDLADALTDLPGVLALPMLDHGTLAGLVLMDLKGNGALYRPDEVAVLGWGAHQVALALAALHAGLIESENRLLKAQLVRLGSLIGDRLDHAGA